MNPTDAEMKAMREQARRRQLQEHGVQLAVSEQMWLELARELAAQGVLNAEALAQRLEAHAQRAEDLPGWFYGLRQAAILLRQPGFDPDGLVQ